MHTKLYIPLFLLLCLLFSANYANAQTGVNLYNRALREQQEALNMEGIVTKGDKQTLNSIAEKHESAAANFLAANEKLKKAEDKCKFNAYLEYARAAHQYFAMEDINKAYAALAKAVLIWPQPGNLNAKNLNKESVAKEDGRRYRLSGVASDSFSLFTFYEARSLASLAAMETNHNDEAASYASQVAEKTGQFPGLVWIPEYVLFKIERDRQDNCKAIEHAVKSLEATETSKPLELADKKEGYIKDMVGFIRNHIDEECADKALMGRTAIALSKVGWVKQQQQTLAIGNKAYEKGSRDIDLYFAMANMSRENGEVEKEKEWMTRLVDRKRKFSSTQWTRLAVIYNINNQPDDANYANRKARKKYRWENTSLLIGTNPVNLFFGEYLGSVDFIRPNFSHCVRVNIMQNSTRYYLHNNLEDNLQGLLSLDYSGHQFSYTFKYIYNKTKKASGKLPYIGPQFRYTYRDFAPVMVDAKGAGAGDTVTAMFHGINETLDITLQFGQIVKGKRFFYDLFAGVGMGYKSLVGTFTTTDGKITYPAYKIQDESLREGRWNKPYIAVRFGIRIGIVL